MNYYRLSRTVVIVLAAFVIAAACTRTVEEFDLDLLHVADDITLTYWMPVPRSDLSRLDMNQHPLYAELERVTGVKVVFEHQISTLEAQQLKLLQESSSLPDIVEWNWRDSYPGGPDRAIEDGVIRPLRELVLRDAPNYFKLISADEQIARSVTTESGTLYAFANLRIDPETRTTGGLMIRRKWLDQIGLDVPETIDQWRNMMISMREADFDTPFQGPEYPFFFPAFRTSYSESAATFFFLEETNAFAGSWGVSHDLYRDTEGRVRYGPIQPGYLEMLSELNRWFEEGFIHPVLASPQTGGGFIEVIAKSGATLGIYGLMSFLSPMDYVAAPAPILDDRTTLVGPQLMPYSGAERAAAISASSDMASEAARWLDVAYSQWGKRLFNFGILGESYRLERGEPILTEPMINSHRSTLGNLSNLLGDLANYSRIPIGGPFEQSGVVLEQLRSLGAGYGEVGNPWSSRAAPAPSIVLTFDADRSEEYSRIMGPITAHARANLAAFITGQRPLTEFDAFAREINEMKVNEAIALIYQAEVDFYAKSVW